MTAPEPPLTYCANHPQRATRLRCNRCEKYICTECAVLTETGYRCKECLRSQQKVFKTATWMDYPLAIGIGLLLSFLGSLLISLVSSLGFFGFITLLIAPAVGGIIAGAIRQATHRHRSPGLFRWTAIAVAAGALPLVLINLLPVLGLGGRMVGFLFPVIWQSVYAFIVTTTVYYRLSGIRLGR